MSAPTDGTPPPQTLFYFHVHNGKGTGHAPDSDDPDNPGFTYEIVIVCEEHRVVVETDEDAEFITETQDEDEHCDKCAACATPRSPLNNVTSNR